MNEHQHYTPPPSQVADHINARALVTAREEARQLAVTRQALADIAADLRQALASDDFHGTRSLMHACIRRADDARLGVPR